MKAPTLCDMIWEADHCNMTKWESAGIWERGKEVRENKQRPEVGDDVLRDSETEREKKKR